MFIANDHNNYCPILLTRHRCIISRLVHKIFYLPSTFGIYRKFYENVANTNADNETYCTVLLTSQVVLAQSLQPKGPKFESTQVLFFCIFLYFYLFNFIIIDHHDL